MVDVVIPTVSGREDSLERLIESCERNTAAPLNFIVIRDQESCGQAWIEGLKLTLHDYVWLACDDLEVTSPTWAGACIEATDHGLIPCATIRRPDGGIESCGGDMRAPGSLIREEQPHGTEVDFSPSPFLSRRQAKAIGMLPIHYYSDVWASYKGRVLGYPTVVTGGFELTHHHLNVGRKAPSVADLKTFEEAMGL